jgi:hypothetical protein
LAVAGRGRISDEPSRRFVGRDGRTVSIVESMPEWRVVVVRILAVAHKAEFLDCWIARRPTERVVEGVAALVGQMAGHVARVSDATDRQRGDGG